MDIKILHREFSQKQIMLMEIAMIVIFAIFPLFITFPYRVNIFLSYEGAFRMSNGEVPFKDFGLPMGFGYWLIPTLFFKLFGPLMSSLIKAQVFINILSGLAFRSILSSFSEDHGKRFVCLFLFCLSYSFFNFWPWYNHSVFVYQFIAFAFLFNAINKHKNGPWYILSLVLAGFFSFISFFTKQDGGALGILIALAILSYELLFHKKWLQLLIYVGACALTAICFIVPFLDNEFTYWFNVGQTPHNSRFSINDIFDATFGESRWIKFYLFAILFLLVPQLRKFKDFVKNRKVFVFTLFTLGILAEALIIQVTSYTPPDNNIFYHSFAFAFLFLNLNLNLNVKKLPALAFSFLFILVWWSGAYWKYIGRMVMRVLPQDEMAAQQKVSRHSYLVNTDTTFTNVPMHEWIQTDLKGFDVLRMPPSTVEGMNKIKNLDLFKHGNKPKVLNMTELTPLAHELNYGFDDNQPLWFHKNVAVFDREIKVFCDKIENNYYDLVLFEITPNLNNFFPDEVRESLKKNYKKIDTFLAPRRPTNADIEVYVKK